MFSKFCGLIREGNQTGDGVESDGATYWREVGAQLMKQIMIICSFKLIINVFSLLPGSYSIL